MEIAFTFAGKAMKALLSVLLVTLQFRHRRRDHQMGEKDGADDRGDEDCQETIEDQTENNHKSEEIDRGRGGETLGKQQLPAMRVFMEMATLPAHPGDARAIEETDRRSYKTKYTLQCMKHVCLPYKDHVNPIRHNVLNM